MLFYSENTKSNVVIPILQLPIRFGLFTVSSLLMARQEGSFAMSCFACYQITFGSNWINLHLTQIHFFVLVLLAQFVKSFYFCKRLINQANFYCISIRKPIFNIIYLNIVSAIFQLYFDDAYVDLNKNVYNFLSRFVYNVSSSTQHCIPFLYKAQTMNGPRFGIVCLTLL